MNQDLDLIIAEDSPRDREYLIATLQKYRLTVAATGDEAWKLCQARPAPWLISDIQMPGMNGVELARRIWSEKPQARLLFWTQFRDETYVRALAKLIPPETVYGYVLKTNPAEILSRAADAVFLECQCWIDPDVRRVQARLQRRDSALTDAEYEVLVDMALGMTDQAIARRRYLSRRGVQNRLQSLYAKLGANVPAEGNQEIDQVNVRARAVALALQRGLINATELAREEIQLHEWLQRADQNSY